MRLTSNAGQILRRMQRRKRAIRTELERAARRIGPKLNATSKIIMQGRIYNVPIPAKASAPKSVLKKTTKGKHGLWQRTGNLKRSELYRVEGATVVLTNNAEYAVPRFNLGTSRGRQIKSPGVQSVQWQWEAIMQERDFIVKARREAVLRSLRA